MPQPYWGQRSGQFGCPGCHHVSPDGKFVAIVEFGLILRTPVELQGVSAAAKGLFDRTGTITTDRRLRRSVFLYVELPNASTF